MSIHRPYFKKDSSGRLVSFDYEDAVRSRRVGLDSTAEVAVAVWDLALVQRLEEENQRRQRDAESFLARLESLSFHEWLSMSTGRTLAFIGFIVWTLTMTAFGVAWLAERFP